MTDRFRITLASAVTALFLAAVSVAGVVAHSARPLAVSAPVSHGALIVGSRGPGQREAAPTSNQQEHD